MKEVIHVCKKCKEKKPFTSQYFVVDKARSSGLRETCKDCRNKQTRSWYQKSYNDNQDFRDSKLAYNRNYKHKISKELSPTFIKYRLVSNISKQGVKMIHSDFNEEVIKLKQKHLCLIRTLKQAM